MKIAVVGSRNLKISDEQLAQYLADTDEIISGGAKGVDTCAASYAERNGIKLTVFLPEYKHYGRAAPIVRNKAIVNYADKVIIFWDGYSKGALSVIKYSEKVHKEYEVIILNENKSII